MIDTSIEPKILPLVEAINNTMLFKTFSSCEGHYLKKDQKQYMNRSKADVKFDALPQTALEKTERFITFLFTEFERAHSFSPVSLAVFKLYAPILGLDVKNYDPEYVFVLQLEPFARYDLANKKRKDTDKAIIRAAKIVDNYTINYKHLL